MKSRLPSGMADLKLLDDNVIPFRLRIDNLTIFMAVVVFIALGIMYGFYNIQGRYTGYLPTITEVAAAAPDSMIFSTVFSVLSFLIFLVFSVGVTWGEVYAVFDFWFLVAGYVSAFVCSIFLVVTANFLPKDSFISGDVGSLPFALATTIFMSGLTWKMYKELPKSIRILRLTVIGIAAVTILMSCVPFPVSLGANRTKTAICQLVFIVVVAIFVVSLRREIGQLQIDLLILHEGN